MDMKINGTQNPIDPRLNGASPVNGAQVAPPAERTSPTRSTAVEATVSERARLLQKAHATLDETPGVRQEKVDALKQAVAQGNYHVDFRWLADKMLRLVK